MATISRHDIAGDRWHQVPASWGTYLRLLRDRGERGRPLYTFLDGRLTIVSPGYAHEELVSRLAWMTETLLVLLGIPFRACRETTLKDGESREKGTEPDSGYYIDPEKLARIQGRKRLRMGVDPAPDLVLEVVVSHPVRDALNVLSRLEVGEVWVVKGNRLRFLVRDDDGRYVERPASAALPFLLAEDLAPWLDPPDNHRSETEVRRSFVPFVTNVLTHRIAST